MRTLVVLSQPRAWPDDVDCLAVDLDLRSDSDDVARERTHAAAAALAAHTRLYLKIDSTLRGPIAAMVDGALSGAGLDHAIVAPAFAEQGRIYRQGVLQSTGASLRDALGAIAQRCQLVDDPNEVTPASDALLVGSAGLARHLAGPSVASLRRGHTPVLVVAGSPTEVTRRQLDLLPPDVAILRSPPSTTRDAGEAAADLARAAITNPRPGLLILTGGQTARLVCLALGATGIELLGEVQPGVPVGTLHGGQWHDVLVVTKAGSFGIDETLLDVLRLVGPSCLEAP